MKESEKLFSSQALERLRNPDQMDSLLTIIPLGGWAALLAVALLVLSVCVWSVFGVIAEKVNGFGMLVDSGGIVNVESLSSGQIEKIYVHKGARVKAGDLLAVLQQPDLAEDKIMAEYSIGLAKSNTDAMSSLAQYDSITQKYDTYRYVYSPFDGIVSEIKITDGSVVGAGTDLFSVRRDQKSNDMHGVMYAPAAGGKKVKPGMVVQMQPNDIDASEYGSLLGIVRETSEYPVSAERMVKTLGNKALADVALEKCDGAAMEIHVELIRDKDNSSGYLWSSVIDNNIMVTPGSVYSGMIIVERKPPISKVFGKLSNWLRND
ncbi:MAG: biotin/lipoyl-binding protein [Phascolarctobacterium sp.]|uniref:biotin/lipoyl-binding protein n=1 Tax=Phascolarctobacterium sp. TaxID=2049039 RepID=UPI0026DADF2D|nr:biotin/lipoyl-binding protein [Phascolarctobacterium sp.]MDO4920729.1 biotin/lipoyl-binding protein [Phascolarctobacterium sp.]